MLAGRQAWQANDYIIFVSDVAYFAYILSLLTYFKSIFIILIDKDNNIRTVSTYVAADALGIDHKLLDNILAGAATPIVPPGRRGRSRQIRFETIEIVAVALILQRDLGVPIAKGIRAGRSLVQAHGHTIPIGSLGAIHFDLDRLRAAIEQALVEALEHFIPARRGRPPGAARQADKQRVVPKNGSGAPP